MKPERKMKIKEEVISQLEARFLKVTHYPEWFANIVPISKNYRKVRKCIDYRDLNKERPKDTFRCSISMSL